MNTEEEGGASPVVGMAAALPVVGRAEALPRWRMLSWMRMRTTVGLCLGPYGGPRGRALSSTGVSRN